MEISSLPHALTTTTLLILINLSFVKTDTKDTQFITYICETTTYPDLCLASLLSYAQAVHGNRNLMMISALSVAVIRTRSASATVGNLLRTNGLTLQPREATALSDCVEQLGDAVAELQKSIEELRSRDEDWLKSDIQTRVGTALTSDDTCWEGFSGEDMNGYVKESVRVNVVDVARLVTNALSLVSQLK